MSVQIEERPDAHGRPCLRLRRGQTEVRLLLGAGPRLTFLGGVESENLLYEEPIDAPARQNGWRLIGGHRLWTAPEDPTLTYVADNTPVEVERLADGVILRGATEGPTGIRKSLGVRMTAGGIRVRHTLEQLEDSSRRAPWAITAFGPGGTVWMPRVQHRPHPDALLPDQSLVLWPYTDLTDPRLDLGPRSIRIHHDAAHTASIKIGAAHPPGWLAWSRGRDVVVQHTRIHTGPQPDLGATHEIYVDGGMSELEALGPVSKMEPGDVTVLEQTWWHERVEQPVDESSLGRLVRSLGLDPAGLATG